ncbi:ABC transporter ATP-binding protein [Candidatus Finniella inopinata]|uniref:ABC transporter ATP-binding protein n=1 Tax=Candidatus Finniella inopinata TaxID=1696036 RepID=A0A4Q7DJX3_9PROT|nr:ABC transporter ATP-binding protein [Candidatus Finniella inopinata]RZI47052.1 ABC transporter ATP-binding protein [Candidatus Finniella inopinata]
MIKYSLQLHQVKRHFVQGGQTLEVLKNINLQLKKGESVALVGPSGAGKTTLLQICGLLEAPTSGILKIDGQSCESLDDFQRTILRRQYLGFVYQFHHLLPEFSALENVMFPQLINGETKPKARAQAELLLKNMGLEHRLHHRPNQLSGGEQQRVAIARAVSNSPKVLLADEPTGNLDNATGEKVFSEMLNLVSNANLSALIATHNMELAARMDRIVYLKDGVLLA